MVPGFDNIPKQARAELCQAQHSLSLDLDTNWLGLITQPAVAGARSLAELQLRITGRKGWFGG